MSKEIALGLDDKEQLTIVAKALSSEVRIEIIKLLNLMSLNVNEISERLEIPASTAALNVKVLEEAGLIHTELQPGTRGSMKLCSLKRGLIKIQLNSAFIDINSTSFINIPIGNYVDCKVTPTCGLVNDKVYIGAEDDQRSFYKPEHTGAQLIWFHSGYLEYRFPNNDIQGKLVRSIEISMEICSEAPNYQNDWPSDITLWINDIECGMWTSPGDFGGRRGILNPPFWSDGSTQFGILKTWKVTSKGTFIDGKPVGQVKIQDLKLVEGDYASFRIGVKEDAENVGGMNIFGEKFGDHNQNIVIRLEY
ncbi:MAG TPA: helix-turn-helix domain-containing protein [Epulopiscium sp.]|nr:helix-turn-helix domain-containing protein [Candidatus Epulonipiscium sp.]